MTGVCVVVIFSEKGCDEQRWDVCPDVQNGIDGGVIWSGDVVLGVVLPVESLELEEVGLEWMDVGATLGIQDSREELGPEIDLGSFPQHLSWWIQRYPSPV